MSQATCEVAIAGGLLVSPELSAEFSPVSYSIYVHWA